MAFSIDLSTFKITIPQSDLTPITGDLYELDTDAFWEELKAWEAGETGIVFDDAQDHNSAYSIGGVTYAQKVEILTPYSIEFENGAYSVRLTGSNNNLFDKEAGILNYNLVQVIGQNSAGLIQTAVSGLTAQESADLAKLRKAFLNAQHVLEGSTGNFKIWDDGDDPNVDPPLYTQDITDKDGNPIVLPPGAPAKRSEAT